MTQQYCSLGKDPLSLFFFHIYFSFCFFFFNKKVNKYVALQIKQNVIHQDQLSWVQCVSQSHVPQYRITDYLQHSRQLMSLDMCKYYYHYYVFIELVYKIFNILGLRRSFIQIFLIILASCTVHSSFKYFMKDIKKFLCRKTFYGLLK